ncbi:hypothetical protein E2562_027909 [Oryza meyeriana var. granulata]|uniref:Uncharacterized protein n=1 Tax=Oryza meyeriana var. granulata TaxID=110450 RepID=A0A6G1EZQ9_9ORYZ|nr:hypothetical protein E2562_027909 [Oryza meyeriana var. granulata]
MEVTVKKSDEDTLMKAQDVASMEVEGLGSDTSLFEDHRASGSNDEGNEDGLGQEKGGDDDMGEKRDSKRAQNDDMIIDEGDKGAAGSNGKQEQSKQGDSKVREMAMEILDMAVDKVLKEAWERAQEEE